MTPTDELIHKNHALIHKIEYKRYEYETTENSTHIEILCP